jgi:hypothetical protein
VLHNPRRRLRRDKKDQWARISRSLLHYTIPDISISTIHRVCVGFSRLVSGQSARIGGGCSDGMIGSKVVTRYESAVTFCIALPDGWSMVISNSMGARAGVPMVYSIIDGVSSCYSLDCSTTLSW